MFQTEDMIEQHNLLSEAADLIDQKVIRTTLNQRLSPINAENIKKAHTLLETGTDVDKIAIEHFK